MQIENISLEKERFRKKHLIIRDSLSKDKKLNMDIQIQSKFLVSNEYYENNLILTYVSKQSEVDTINIITSAIANGKKVAASYFEKHSNNMDFYYIKSITDLVRGDFNVMVPRPEEENLVTDFSNSLCLVPGICFDLNGYRIGYGKGYYDKFLSGYSGTSIGLCYTGCTQWNLPHDTFDVGVDIIITDKYFRKTK